MSARPLLRVSHRCLTSNVSFLTPFSRINPSIVVTPSAVSFNTSTHQFYPRRRPIGRVRDDVTSELPGSIEQNHRYLATDVERSQPESSTLVSWSAIEPRRDAELEAPADILDSQTNNSQKLTDDSSLPWYLRSQHSKKTLSPDHPFPDRQKLPDLPPDPPPILQGVLEYISTDLGLDNLSVLDLRALDPPPALGSSLLMLLGSARSEKHLHVSADRLCRWLRTAHRLTPYADGLLGRNELKLKLRRKNKRSRLLASVGAAERLDIDDGVSTGWICVHAGRVGAAAGAPDEQVEESAEEVQGFVGFGEKMGGVTLVVQMFTEDKRAETDLEGLWTEHLEKNLRRQRQQQQQLSGAERDDQLDDEAKPDSQKWRRAHLNSRLQLPTSYQPPAAESGLEVQR